MARLTADEWLQVQADFEVKKLSNRELAGVYGISETAIRKRAKSRGWVKGKSSHLAKKKIKCINELNKISSQSSRLSSHHVNAIDDVVNQSILFQDSAMRNQELANNLLEEEDLTLQSVETHSRITGRNKETVLGKNPDTAIQINNTNQPNAIEVVFIEPD